MLKLKRNKYQKPLIRLLTKRSELLSGFKGKLGPLQRMESPAMDDLAPVLHEQFVALQLSQLDFQHLKLIDEAMARVSQGEYGRCIDCGSAIAPARLLAIAWAARCVTCEEAHAEYWQSADETGMASAD